MIRSARAAVAACIFWSIAPPALANEPDVPPGLDPGGVAVALFGKGVDYVRPELAQRLARDGEGDLIAWDFTDNDTKPYAASGQSNDDALYLAANGPLIKLIVIKEQPGNPAAIGHMATFMVRTPARVAVWPDGSPQRADWPILFKAAQRFSDRLFIVPGPLQSPPDDRPPNVVAPKKSAGSDPRTATLDIAVRAATILKKSPDLPLNELIKALNR